MGRYTVSITQYYIYIRKYINVQNAVNNYKTHYLAVTR